MASEAQGSLVCAVNESNKTIFKKSHTNRRSLLRNARRRQRRKRSSNRYHRNLRLRRKYRKYEELCSELEAVAVFDMSNSMEWKCSNSFGNSTQEIASWYQKEQVAYWKSKALSLEYENRMLHEHLRDVYAQHIDHYNSASREYDNANSRQLKDSPDKNLVRSVDRREMKHEEIQESENTEETNVDSNISNIPSEPIGIRRRTEMRKLYGSNQPLIAGIETALQLNYDHAAKKKPAYWPQLQLNLG